MGRPLLLGIFASLVCPAVVAAQTEEEKLAADLANPLATITTLLTQYRAEFTVGPNMDTNHQLRLNPPTFVPTSGGSALLVRGVVPFIARNGRRGHRTGRPDAGPLLGPVHDGVDLPRVPRRPRDDDRRDERVRESTELALSDLGV